MSGYVSDILRGVPPPWNAPGGRIAFKTGTSDGHRHAWSIGFDGKRTIVGRPP
jgi:penicillin-binding protein 1C